MQRSLRVEFDRLSEEARARAPGEAIYLDASGNHVLASVGAPDLVIWAVTELSRHECLSRLEEEGFAVREGCWMSDADALATERGPMPWVVAVAYASAKGRPGLWVDATAEEPSQADVLRTMYEEFRETGDVADVTIEEFIRAANPNVVILSPDEVRRFAERKGC